MEDLHPFRKRFRSRAPGLHGALHPRTTAERLAVLVITLMAAVLLMTALKVWAHPWQKYFFFLEDWRSLLFISIAVTIAVHVIADLLKWEFRLFERGI